MAKGSVSATHDRLAGYTLGKAPVAVPDAPQQPEVFVQGQG